MRSRPSMTVVLKEIVVCRSNKLWRVRTWMVIGRRSGFILLQLVI